MEPWILAGAVCLVVITGVLAMLAYAMHAFVDAFVDVLADEQDEL
jgi:hypothetical protein